MIARASQWSVTEACAATRGRSFGAADRRIAGVSTDTRDALRDQLFVALRGERFDAHKFLDVAVAQGASALVVEASAVSDEAAEALARDVAVIVVEDALTALGDLARAHRRRLGTRCVGLTGSNGKTTTKEMIAAILGQSRRVLKTAGNLNNLIGLPMTLLGLTPEHDVAVVEMGMNATGEIARLTEIAEPSVGLVVNVGPAHIGMLGSMEAIAAAKGELYAGLGRDGVAVVNLDDERVRRAAEQLHDGAKWTFGADERADVRLISWRPKGTGQRVCIQVRGERLETDVPYPGAHNAMNAAAAVAAVTAANLDGAVSTQDIVAGLQASTLVQGRLQTRSIGPYDVVDDCYNANAASMIAAVETVSARAKAEGRRLVALLGEMRELGEWSDAEHARVGSALAEQGASIVAAFGPMAAPIATAAREGGVVEVMHEAKDDAALGGWLSSCLREGDVILVKGSRGIRMERFIEWLEGEVD